MKQIKRYGSAVVTFGTMDLPMLDDDENDEWDVRAKTLRYSPPRTEGGGPYITHIAITCGSGLTVIAGPGAFTQKKDDGTAPDQLDEFIARLLEHGFSQQTSTVKDGDKAERCRMMMWDAKMAVDMLRRSLGFELDRKAVIDVGEWVAMALAKTGERVSMKDAIYTITGAWVSETLKAAAQSRKPCEPIPSTMDGGKGKLKSEDVDYHNAVAAAGQLTWDMGCLLVTMMSGPLAMDGQMMQGGDTVEAMRQVMDEEMVYGTFWFLPETPQDTIN
jgi:hypothetical protein